MIPKLHKKGAGIKGLATYLLHDKDGAKTAERVAWTETRNLATNSPEAAWRVMAATAMDRNRIKQQAGTSAVGRKAKNLFVHASLSWHPEQAEGLTKEEMMRAAGLLIRELGAEDQQTLIVCHNDEEQPHVHVVFSRIDTDNGTLIKDAWDKRLSQRFASNYERETGKIYCHDREINRAARDRGTYVRGKKDRPRHIFELEKGAGDQLWAQELRQEQLEKDVELRRKTDTQKVRHAEEWGELDTQFNVDRIALRLEGRRDVTTARNNVGEGYIDQFVNLELEHEEERDAFHEREKTLHGKGLNLLRSIDFRGLLRKDRRTVAIKEAFGLLAGRQNKRTEALRCKQQREMVRLEQEEREAKNIAMRAVVEKNRQRMQQLRDRYLLDRKRIEVQQSVQRAWIANEWRTRRKDRELAWETAHKREATRTIDAEFTPDEKRQKAAERFMGRMRKARSERARERGKGKLKDEFQKNRGRKPDKDDGWDR